VPQRSRPYFLLIELQLYGRIPNLVFDNPESIDDLRKFAHQMTYKQSPLTGVGTQHSRPESLPNP